MVVITRIYKHKTGAKNYVDYSEEVLKASIDSVRNGTITQTAAEAYFKVPEKVTL
jgi:hypothetical protein